MLSTRSCLVHLPGSRCCLIPLVSARSQPLLWASRAYCSQPDETTMTQPSAAAEQLSTAQPGAVQANAIEAGAVQQAVVQQDTVKAVQQEASTQQQGAAADSNGADTSELLWYWGFGSMCNPISLRRRGIHPTRSLPACAAGWKLRFHLSNGMANIEPDEGSVAHGVLHLITPKMMEALAKLETIYNVEQVTVTPYQPGNVSAKLAPVTASAFYVPPERVPCVTDGKEQLPGDRYIRIITGGLRHFGVDPEWTDAIAATPARPTCQPKDYHQLPAPLNPETLPVWSAQQLTEHRGCKPVVFALGDKVLEVVAGDAVLEEIPYGRILLEHFSGTEVAYMAIMALYEPLLPECTCPADIKQEHIAWAENEVMTQMAPLGFKVTRIATLAPGAAHEARMTRAAAAAHATGAAPTAPAAAAAGTAGTAAAAAAAPA